jgi:hypothetical protein
MWILICLFLSCSLGADDRVAQSIDAALRSCDRAESLLPEITRLGEIIARRHLAGGLIGCPFPCPRN